MAHEADDTELERLADGTVIEAALREGVQEALRRHKVLGNPVAERRDGRVGWIAPEDIPVDVNEMPPVETDS